MYQSLQGNLGLGKAINFFISEGYIVSIPLNDTQPYDIIVDKDGKLYKVSVKTSRHKENKNYVVQLRNTGGNRTGSIRQVPFDNTKADFLFVYTIEERCFLIPTEDIQATNSIVVGEKYKQYEVFIKSFGKFIEEKIQK